MGPIPNPGLWRRLVSFLALCTTDFVVKLLSATSNAVIRAAGAAAGVNELQFGIDASGNVTITSSTGKITLTPGNGNFIVSGYLLVGNTDVRLSRAAGSVLGLDDGFAGPLGISDPMLTPATIAANVDDYAPGVGWVQRWSSDASRNVTGMAAKSWERRVIWNVGAQNIVLVNESASSTATNRWKTSTGADLTLAANKCAFADYDNTTGRWRVCLGN